MPLEHFEIDGGTLAVDVDGRGPLIICAPGLGDTRDVYDPIASQLTSNGYSVAKMDNRGAGDSSIDFDSYGDEATADDFVLLAEKLGKGSRVFLAGDSFAAASAVIAAAKRPDLVAGLILLAPFLRNPMGALGLWIMPPMFMRPWGPTTLWPGLGDKAGDRAARSTAHLTRPGRWAAFQRHSSSLDHRVVAPYFDKVHVPVIVFMGDKDPDWSKPSDEAQWVASNFKDVDSVVVEGCGHAPMLENPELVGDAMLKFVIAHTWRSSEDERLSRRGYERLQPVSHWRSEAFEVCWGALHGSRECMAPDCRSLEFAMRDKSYIIIEESLLVFSVCKGSEYTVEDAK